MSIKLLSGTGKRLMHRKLILFFSLALVLLAPCHAQSLPAESARLPEFDAVSVKPASETENRMMMSMIPDGFRIVNFPLVMILRQAFSVEEDQIVGAPDWVRSTRFDIEAKVAPADVDAFKKLTSKQRGQMMLSILTERFALKSHNETRELPVYELVVAKGGPKMKEAQTPSPAANPAPGTGQRQGGQMRMQPGKLTALGVSMSTLVGILSQQHIGRIVVDKTGLTGFYDFTLEWMPEGGMMINGAPAPPPPPGSLAEEPIFTAVQEQLGLKLEPHKDPLPVFVIDHIEKPMAN